MLLSAFLIILIVVLLFLNKKKEKEDLVTVDNFKNQEIVTSDTFPNVIHKTLFESTGDENKVSSKIAEAISSWTEQNPTYRIKLWTLKSAREFLINEFPKQVINCFDNLIPYAFKSDFFRYCVIYKLGGWYSDLKQVCLERNLLDNIKRIKRDIYLYKDVAHVKYEDSNVDYCIQNAFFGAYKNNEFLYECIKQTIENTKNKEYGECIRCAAGSVCVIGKIFYQLGYDDSYFVGYFDINSGAYFYDNFGDEIILHKCFGCDNEWIKNGNNYQILWKNKSLYQST